MMRRLAAALLLLLAGCAAATAAEPRDATFAISRYDSRIGTMTLDFRREGETTVVETRLEVVVKVLFVTAYRYTQQRTETWSGDRLLSYEVRTDDNGTESRASARLQGDRLVVAREAGPATAPTDAVPATFWNPVTVSRSVLIDVDDATPRKVAAVDQGVETVEVGGRRIAARRWKITGDLERTIWYAAEGGDWVMLSFAARDGSPITYERQP